jgi:hypothetical protein
MLTSGRLRDDEIFGNHRSKSLRASRAVCTNILHFRARVVVTSEDALPLSIVLEELSGARERPMIISMPTTARFQQHYDRAVPPDILDFAARVVVTPALPIVLEELSAV